MQRVDQVFTSKVRLPACGPTAKTSPRRLITSVAFARNGGLHDLRHRRDDMAFRGNATALDAIDNATTRSISSVTYVELLQGVRNKVEMLSMKRFLSTLGFATLPVTAEISTHAISIMEAPALKNDLGVSDVLIFATALETGDTLLSDNAKYFKEVPLLDAVVFRA